MTLSRRVFAGWLLCALVAAQALGLMHRIVHLPHGPWQAHEHAHEYAHEHAHEHAHADAHGHEGLGWVADLFAGHDDDSSCRLFDPLNHEGAACVPAVVLPAVAALFFLETLQGDFVARWAALFDARGPPAAA